MDYHSKTKSILSRPEETSVSAFTLSLTFDKTPLATHDLLALESVGYGRDRGAAKATT